jgi:hypothetical protein
VRDDCPCDPSLRFGVTEGSCRSFRVRWMRKAMSKASRAVPARPSPFRHVIAALTRTPSDWIRGGGIVRFGPRGRSLGRQRDREA